MSRETLKPQLGEAQPENAFATAGRLSKVGVGAAVGALSEDLAKNGEATVVACLENFDPCCLRLAPFVNSRGRTDRFERSRRPIHADPLHLRVVS